MAGRRGRPEDAIQRGIVSLLKAALSPGIYYAAIPNGGYRSKAEAAIMVGLGVRAGVADLMIVAPGGRVHFVEVKAANGRLSPAQRDFAAWCRDHDIPHAVVRSVEEAHDALRRWGLTRANITEQSRAA